MARVCKYAPPRCPSVKPRHRHLPEAERVPREVHCRHGPGDCRDHGRQQRPCVGSAFAGTSEAAAWRAISSRYLVSRQDQAIAPGDERYLAKRAKAHTEEANSSPAVMVGHIDLVTHLIDKADRGTR